MIGANWRYGAVIVGRSPVAPMCVASLEEPTTHEYGERSCVLEDLAGHRWELTQTMRDVAPEEWGGTAVRRW